MKTVGITSRTKLIAEITFPKLGITIWSFIDEHNQEGRRWELQSELESESDSESESELISEITFPKLGITI